MATKFPNVQSSLSASTMALNSIDDSLLQQGCLLGARASSSTESIQTSVSSGVYLEPDDAPPSLLPRRPINPAVSRPATPKSAATEPRPITHNPTSMDLAKRPLPQLPHPHYQGRESSIHSEHVYSGSAYDTASLGSQICLSDADKDMLKRLDITYPEQEQQYNISCTDTTIYQTSLLEINASLINCPADDESSDDEVTEIVAELSSSKAARGKENVYAPLKSTTDAEMPSTSTAFQSKVEIEMQPLKAKAEKLGLEEETVSLTKAKAKADITKTNKPKDVPFLQTKWGKAVAVFACFGLLTGMGGGLGLAYMLLNKSNKNAPATTSKDLAPQPAPTMIPADTNPCGDKYAEIMSDFATNYSAQYRFWRSGESMVQVYDYVDFDDQEVSFIKGHIHQIYDEANNMTRWYYIEKNVKKKPEMVFKKSKSSRNVIFLGSAKGCL